MPAHRKSLQGLALSGQLRKNPGRYRDRQESPIPSGPLGDPPRGLTAREVTAWRELSSLAPPGVLTNADRWLVEVCSRLMAKMRKSGLGSGELAQLLQALYRLGLSPTDRPRVSVAPHKEAVDNVFTRLASERDADVN